MVGHSIKQYLQNSSVTQGSLESQAHCLAAPRLFLLKGNINVRVVEALHTHQSYIYYTCTNGSDPQCFLNQVLSLWGRCLQLPTLPISSHLFLLVLSSSGSLSSQLGWMETEQIGSCITGSSSAGLPQGCAQQESRDTAVAQITACKLLPRSAQPAIPGVVKSSPGRGPTCSPLQTWRPAWLQQLQHSQSWPLPWEQGPSGDSAFAPALCLKGSCEWLKRCGFSDIYTDHSIFFPSKQLFPW